MKIAVATEKDAVAPHFGHCEGFTLLEVEDGQVKERRFIPSPPHERGVLPRLLHEQGARAVIAGGMGAGALGMFRDAGIDAVAGAAGPVEEAALAYARGELASGAFECNHDQHGCGH